MRFAQGYIFADEGRGTAVRSLTLDITRQPSGHITVVTTPEGGPVRAEDPTPGSELYLFLSRLLGDLERSGGAAAAAAPPEAATA
jgi:hypothetical protein